MSTSLSGLSTNYFPSAQSGFTTTLASTIASGATTVPLNSVAGYTNGSIAVFVIDPTDATKKQTFTGVIDTSGVQVTSVVWTAGTNVIHSAGATVVDYATATHISMMTKGITTSLDQDGTLKTGAVDVTAVIADGVVTKAKLATAEKTAFDSGWSPKYGDTTFPAPNTVTALGNRSYSCVFNGVDLTGSVSAGQRLRTTRTVAAPTQCTSLNGTTQYYSKAAPAGYTFTDSFTYSAWVKPTSYALGTIIGRFSTTGSMLQMNASGQLLISAKDAGTTDSALTYQSLPLNKWSHVAMTMVVATNTVTAYIDGVAVPTAYTNGTTTAVTQAGSLEVGGNNGGTNPFPGKIAQAAVYNAVLSNATILASMTQGLAGTETSLISAYSFNNSINDLNANANNLTANGSAVATNADSPFGGQADGTISSTLDYAIVTKTAFSTNTTLTVQVPEGCTIPTSGGVSAVSYATVKVPYGMPAQKEKWTIEAIIKATQTQSSPVQNTWYNLGQNLNIAIGEWLATIEGQMETNAGSAIAVDVEATLSTANNSESDTRWTSRLLNISSSNLQGPFFKQYGISVSSATPYYLNARTTQASSTAVVVADNGPACIRAELAYL